jgi:RNA polymerase sigma factor (sigma-70 family)
MVPGSESPDPSAEPLRRWQDEGDPDALNQLLQIEVGILKHMIRGRKTFSLAGSASASDIAQEAVMGLLKTKTPPRFADPRALRGYLWRSAWHLLVKRLEKRSRMPVRLELENAEALDRFMRGAGALQEVDRAERATAIDFAMNLLTKENRELLKLTYFDGCDIATAGATLGLSRDAANSRLARARRLLAERLSEWSSLID